MQVKFLFSLHLTLLSGLLFAQTPEPMRLHIHFSDASEGYLFIRNLLKPVPDTVRFTNNTCSYTADITETTPFVLTDESNKYQLFFAAPGDQLEVVGQVAPQPRLGHPLRLVLAHQVEHPLALGRLRVSVPADHTGAAPALGHHLARGAAQLGVGLVLPSVGAQR